MLWERLIERRYTYLLVRKPPKTRKKNDLEESEEHSLELTPSWECCQFLPAKLNHLTAYMTGLPQDRRKGGQKVYLKEQCPKVFKSS